MPDRVFRDPVHGLIEFEGDDRVFGEVLETRAAQRLRRIKQMGFAWLVYPGAEHSRFGHALGAFHLARRVARELDLDEEVGRHVKLAALLHDIGHGPYSHAWEAIFAGGDHEEWGVRMAREDDELRAALDRLGDDMVDALCGFWTKTYSPAYARKLVSSQLDVDRLDYLLRDGHYSGAGYATFDLDWIVHALRLEHVHEGPDPTDVVVDYRRGMFAVEQYLFARSYMYAQVYHHKTVRAAEWMFRKILARFAELARADTPPPHLDAAIPLARGERLPIEDYLWLDDLSVTRAISEWAGDGARLGGGAARDPVLADLSRRLARRRLFKTIDLGDDPAVMAVVEPRASEIARKRFGDAAQYYVQLDNARQIGYRTGADLELHVVGHPRHGTVTLGRLLAELPLGRPSSTVRLVCAPELLTELRPICAEIIARERG